MALRSQGVAKAEVRACFIYSRNLLIAHMQWMVSGPIRVLRLVAIRPRNYICEQSSRISHQNIP